MAVNAYIGPNGAGKTYQVVSEVILRALASGRSVVSNIRGLKYDVMRAYLIWEKKVDASRIGTLRCVTNAEVGSPNFFYTDEGRAGFVASRPIGTDAREYERQWDARYVVQPGDLVVIDESWQWIRRGRVIPEAMFSYFRMHRQYVNAVGVSSDVVLISQRIQDIDDTIRGLIIGYYKMRRLGRFGVSKGYEIDVFDGFHISDNDRLYRITTYYKKKFFEMYDSYAGKGGDERVVDSRGSVWRSPLLLGSFVGAGVCAAVGIYVLLHAGIFGKMDKEVKGSPSPVAAPGRALFGDASGRADIAGVRSPVWRLAGFYRGADGVLTAVLNDGARDRLVRARSYVNDGLIWEVQADGKTFTPYSGAVGGRSGVSGLFGGGAIGAGAGGSPPANAFGPSRPSI